MIARIKRYWFILFLTGLFGISFWVPFPLQIAHLQKAHVEDTAASSALAPVTVNAQELRITINRNLVRPEDEGRIAVKSDTIVYVNEPTYIYFTGDALEEESDTPYLTFYGKPWRKVGPNFSTPIVVQIDDIRILPDDTYRGSVVLTYNQDTTPVYGPLIQYEVAIVSFPNVSPIQSAPHSPTAVISAFDVSKACRGPSCEGSRFEQVSDTIVKYTGDCFADFPMFTIQKLDGSQIEVEYDWMDPDGELHIGTDALFSFGLPICSAKFYPATAPQLLN